MTIGAFSFRALPLLSCTGCQLQWGALPRTAPCQKCEDALRRRRCSLEVCSLLCSQHLRQVLDKHKACLCAALAAVQEELGAGFQGEAVSNALGSECAWSYAQTDTRTDMTYDDAHVFALLPHFVPFYSVHLTCPKGAAPCLCSTVPYT